MEDLKKEKLALELEVQKRDMDAQVKWQERDIFVSAQEVNRRGIEVCLSVIKTELAKVNTGGLAGANRDLANAKLKEFLEALKPF